MTAFAVEVIARIFSTRPSPLRGPRSVRTRSTERFAASTLPAASSSGGNRRPSRFSRETSKSRANVATRSRLIVVVIAFFAGFHLVDDRLKGRIGFEQCGVHHIAKLLVRLAHFGVRGLHGRVLHRFLMRGLHFFALIR